MEVPKKEVPDHALDNRNRNHEDDSTSTVLRFGTKGAIAKPPNSAAVEDAISDKAKDPHEDGQPSPNETPLTTAPASAQDQQQQPGAYAHGTRAPFTRRTDHGTPPAPAPAPAPTEDSTRGLAVANAIDESSRRSGTMQRAVQMDAEEQSESKPTGLFSKRHQTHYLLFGASLVILVVLVVLIPLLLLTNSSEEDHKHGSLDSSEAPSSAPSLSFQSHLLSLLPDTTLQALNDPESPQSRALEWTIDDADYNPEFSDVHLIQRFSLATIYYSTQGHNWTNQDKWLSHRHHECDWYAGDLFIAYGKPEFQDYPCHNETQQYERLWLAQNNLNGTFPPEITQLTSLQSFTVDRNANLHISIPSNLHQLSQLNKWSMFQCGLSGTIPTQIGLATQLSLLYLSTSPFYKGPHKLDGTVPSQIGQLTNLEQLTLNSNRLKGSLPSQLGLLKNLNFVSLEDNEFTGRIPTTFGQMGKLFALHMYWNQLMGPIPSQLGLLSSSLREIILANNTQHTNSSSLGLEGSVPSQIGLLSNLGVMFLANNPRLTGTLPTEMAQLSQIYAFDVSGTTIRNDSVPETLQMAQEDTWFDRYFYECRLILPCPAAGRGLKEESEQ